MTQLDRQIHAAIGRSRASHSPPAGCEDAMLAQFHARLDGPPDGGDVGGGTAGPSYTAGAQLVHGLKIVAAVVGLTAAGVGGLALVGKAMRAAEAPDQVTIEDRVEPRPEPKAELPAEAKLPSPEPAVEDEPKSAPIRQPSRPTPASQAAKGSPNTLAAELQLIRTARNATPLEALELIDRHAEQFPDGELRNERESLRVITLCELGRLDEARRAGEHFVATSPGALLLQRVANGCGDRISLPTTESQPAGNRSP
jgi:hypothetical protein